MALGDIRILSNKIENNTREIKLSVVVDTIGINPCATVVNYGTAVSIPEPEEKKIHLKFRITGNEKPCLILNSQYEDGVFVVKCLEKYGKLWHMPFVAKLYVGQLLPGGVSGDDISTLLDIFLK